MISNVGHVMTLANSIIGVGILAMPFCFQRCGIILSILLLVLNYLVTRISCHYLVKSSLLTRKKSFELLAFHAFGTSGKLMVELCIIGYLIGTCIAYFVVVGDLGPQIVAKLFNLNENDNLRTWVMIIVTFLCIIPLGMLKNVDSLSTVCTASIGFYFCLVLKVMAESEQHLLANDWLEHVEYWQPSGILQCLPIFSMALSCQMQLFEVFDTVPNQSLEKMNAIVKNATRICTCVYILVGIFGYLAFCTQTFSGNILVNFSQSLASDVIKMGFVLSVAFSFPLVIFPCRASIYSLLYRRGTTADTSGYIPERRFKTITVFIALLSLSLGLLIPSIELVIGLVGSTIGVAICIMFPASCFLKISKKESSEKSLAQIVLIGGFCLMILGTYANLNAIDEKRSESLTVYHIEETPVNPISKNLDIIQKPDESLSENLVKQIPKIITMKNPSAFMNDSMHQKQILRKKLHDKMNAFKQKQLNLTNNNKDNQNNSKLINRNDQELRVKEINLEYQNRNNNSNMNNSLNMGGGNNLNKYAIQKDDEIAAEEAAKDKQSSLLNAETELKKTKELLEKKVDELKELAKKNQETQSLVVAKLDGIVEKVEEIERQVLEVNNEDDKKIHNKKLLEIVKNNNIEPTKLINNVETEKNIMKDSRKDADEMIKIKPELPFEPLSYKTGEILSKINMNGSLINNNRIGIPLPLLINSTNPKEKIIEIDLNSQHQLVSPQPNLQIENNDDVVVASLKAQHKIEVEIDKNSKSKDQIVAQPRDKREIHENCISNCFGNDPNLFSNKNDASKTGQLNMISIGRDWKSLKKK